MSTSNDDGTPPRPGFPPAAGAPSERGDERTGEGAGATRPVGEPETTRSVGEPGPVRPAGEHEPTRPVGGSEPSRPVSDAETTAGVEPPERPAWGAPPPPPPGGGDAGGSGGCGGWAGWGTPGEPLPDQPGDPGKKKVAGGLVAGALAAALVAGGIGGGIGYWAANDQNSDGSTPISAPENNQKIENPPGSVAAIANKALQSVVTIEARGSGGSGGTGTGFVYDRQGHILTNNHVVASAAQGGQLTATFSNGKTYDAKVVGRAQGYDVAVIKLEKAGDVKLTPLRLGDSDKVDVGDQTIAIGAPFGLSGTVTTGIISAKNRPVASSDETGSKNSYMNALQTDASINPGNSGGPLLDSAGNVIGVNSAIQTGGGGENPFGGQQGGSVGLGFAIPINQAKYVAGELIKTGEPVYAVIGVSVDNSYQGSGAKVSDEGADAVTPGGPADEAGVKPGDVITKIDDTVIDSGPTLIGQLWTHKPGEKVKLTWKSDGKTKTATVTLDARKGDS
ncbi:PDZ domain-containing protein [Streptomyces sp. A7024]|uniref:PDZ domain-containing protein n=1 Tax=Streptomyces coryli TaxID=1128680 RepID=A0A6G4UAA5_9ACTN|nr:PDZ domain-containing protein [Streptomyces coryli]